MQLQDKNNEIVLKAGAGLATLNSHLANSPEGKDTINKTIASIKDDDARAAAARIVQKLPADAKAGDVSTLLETIIKPGFWGTLGGKNTSDDEVIKSFETVYNTGKNDTKSADALKARKTLYNALAAQGIDGAQAAGDLLNKSLGVNPVSAPLTPRRDPRTVDSAQEAALREAATNPVQPMLGSPAQQAVIGLDAALAQTGQAMAKANAAGNAAEVRRLQVLFMQQNAAKQAAMGGK